MLLGVIILIMGIVLILQALGIIAGNFWALFWGIFLLVIGIRMVSKKRTCWHCEWLGHHHENKENER